MKAPRPTPAWDDVTKRRWLCHEGVSWHALEGKVVAEQLPLEYSGHKPVLLGIFPSFEAMFAACWRANELCNNSRSESVLDSLRNDPEEP